MHLVLIVIESYPAAAIRAVMHQIRTEQSCTVYQSTRIEAPIFTLV